MAPRSLGRLSELAALGHDHRPRGPLWLDVKAHPITPTGELALSHVVEIKTEIRDEQAVRAACTRLQLAAPEHKTVRLFNATATGMCVQLPSWQYPVVCNIQTGQVQYDNYNGHWGEQKHLNAFLQGYAVEKAKIEARKKGHSVTETSLQDGSIRVTVKVGGAA
jgi:hypothetical protein